MSEPDRYPVTYDEHHNPHNRWGNKAFESVVCSVCKTFQPVLTSRLVRNPNGTVRWICVDCTLKRDGI